MKQRSNLCWWAVALILAALLTLPGNPHVAAAPARQAARPILLTDPVPDPHQPGVQYFAATGHTLRGAFLGYWMRYGGLAQFGYPLTEEFVEPAGPEQQPLQVQYFERNRFEYHPENAGSPYEVLLGTLGRAFHVPDPPVSPQPGARYFPETGHNLSGAFLTYWDNHGGLFVHGYPLTEPFPEQNTMDGKNYTVQYFERSRFEWHPENAGTPYEVLLGLLGTQLAQKQGYPYGWYPQYGHAADFSWIAGRQPPAPQCQDCCSRFYYAAPRNSAYVQPVSPDWSRVPRPELLHAGELVVLFGRLAGPGEMYTGCEPNYVVDRIERNPIQ